jgi:nitroimidazol reductase NimA-like FMN-containing flavoprotein (pyridoxamine 5'-phosphate oxidase superfamily)
MSILPETRLDPRFSSPNAVPATWTHIQEVLRKSGIYWISTVNSEAQPNVSPISGVWRDEKFFFVTGPGEQKAVNLERNSRCAVTTGSSRFSDGLDVVIQGTVTPVVDASTIAILTADFEHKYDDFFGFTVTEGGFRNRSQGFAGVFTVDAEKIFGFRRGDSFSQTRVTFKR